MSEGAQSPPAPTNRLIKGSALRFGGEILGISISFFMLPFLLGSLGSALYGTWLIVSAVLAYYGIIALGVPSALQRFVSQAHATGDRGRLQALYSAGLLLASAMGLACMLITAGVLAVSYLLQDSTAQWTTFALALSIVSVGTSLSFPGFVYRALHVMRLRYDLMATIDTGKVVLRAAASFVVISLEPSVVSLALVTVVTEVGCTLVIAVLALRENRSLTFDRRTVQPALLREMFGYGWMQIVSDVAVRSRQNAGVLLMPVLGHSASVANFSIAAQVGGYGNSIRSSLLGVMMPTFASLHARGEFEELKTSVHVFARISVALTGCIAGAAICFGEAFLTLWLGEAYSTIYAALVWIMLGTAAASTEYAYSQLRWATGHARFSVVVALSEVLALALLSLLLIPPYGFVGAAQATAGAMFLSRGLLCPVITSRALGIPLGGMLLGFARVALATLSAHAALWYVIRDVDVSSWPMLMACASMAYPLILAFIVLVGLGKPERAWFAGLAQRLTRRRAT